MLVSCGRCQLACTARTVHSRYHYYLCNGKANPERSRREDKCPARFIPAEQLDELVWQDLCTVLTHPEFIRDALQRLQHSQGLPQELQVRRENLRKGIASLTKQLDRLTDAYLHTVIPLAEYERRRRELEQKIQTLAEQERELLTQIDHQREVAGLMTSIEAFCLRIQQGLVQATFEQQRELVLLLIDRVIVTDGDVEIRYVIPTSPASEHVRFCHLRTDYFDHPAPRQDHKAGGGIAAFDDFDEPATVLHHPVGEDWPAIARVGPDQGQFGKPLRKGGGQHLLGAFAFRHIGGCHHHLEHQAQDIHQNVSLAAGHQLGAIVAACPGHRARLDRLTIQNRGCGFGGAVFLFAHGPRKAAFNCSQRPSLRQPLK